MDRLREHSGEATAAEEDHDDPRQQGTGGRQEPQARPPAALRVARGVSVRVPRVDDD